MIYQREISNTIYSQHNCGITCKQNLSIEGTTYSNEGPQQNLQETQRLHIWGLQQIYKENDRLILCDTL